MCTLHSLRGDRAAPTPLRHVRRRRHGDEFSSHRRQVRSLSGRVLSTAGYTQLTAAHRGAQSAYTSGEFPGALRCHKDMHKHTRGAVTIIVYSCAGSSSSLILLYLSIVSCPASRACAKRSNADIHSWTIRSWLYRQRFYSRGVHLKAPAKTWKMTPIHTSLRIPEFRMSAKSFS